MKQDVENRNRWLHIRLRPEEHKKLLSLKEKSICPRLSDYARRVILNVPVTMRQRDQSMDEFMGEMIKLRAELNAIGNNFNQAVHKLHVLKGVHSYRAWAQQNEATMFQLIDKTEEIKNRINQFADRWLQS